jgi:tetratricopeptide (TPR) repeat protein
MKGPALRSDAIAEDFRSAYAHHRAGKLEKAEALYRKVLKRLPGHPDSLNMLGLIALSRGRPQRAIQLIGEAVQRKPDFADAHSNLGNALLAAGRGSDAIESYRRAVALAPSSAGPSYNLFVALRGLKRTAEAEAAIRAALASNPAALDWRRDLATTLMELERHDEALTILDGLLALRPGNAGDTLARAAVLYRKGEFAQSEAAYRRATALTPADADAWNGLGLVLRALGRFEDAETALLRACDLAPASADARRNLGLIGKLKPGETERLSALADNVNAAAADRIAAGFALGKLLDEAGQYDAAFEAYRAANERFLTASGRRYDPAAFTAEINRIIAAPHLPAAPNRSELPVFVVGMPRSGTSLVEQIAASHPKVHGAGEMKDIGRIAASLNTDNAQALAGEHLERLRRLGGGAERVIDKMPDNIFMLGHIAALFPASRVIVCRRDPRDTCLSCYFTLFASGNLFSYDLADCAHRCGETERLMRHWLEKPALSMLTMEYESLVADIEGQSRRLIAFLGLDWDPACLDFHETQRPVTTASSWQVRQPLYQRSAGRWRNYSRHIPALDGLAVTQP